MAEKIRYEVDVDSSDAKRGLQDFSRAAKKAGKDASSALDDTASAGDKARAAIKQMADAMDAELRASAKAAEALGEALGPELAGRTDLDKMVADLGRMGVSFDEVTADADKFATTLREVDAIRLGQNADGLEQVRTRMDSARGGADNLTASAQKSRNAMANMVGNAAQDLGAFVGLAGSAGVALGQLAEGAQDARNDGEGLGSVLKGVASTALPIAGIAVATQLVGSAMARAKKDAAELEASIEKFTSGMQDTIGVADKLDASLDAAFDVGQADEMAIVAREFQEAITPDKVNEYQTALAALNLTNAEYVAGLAAGDGTFRSWTEQILINAGATRDQAAAVAESIDKQESYDEIVQTLLDANRDWAEQNEQLITGLEGIDDVVGALNIEDMARNFLTAQRGVEGETDAVDKAIDSTGSYADALTSYIAVKQRQIALDAQARTSLAAQVTMWDSITAATKAATDAEKARHDQLMADVAAKILDDEKVMWESIATGTEEATAAAKEHEIAIAEAGETIRDLIAEAPDLAGALTAGLDEVDAVFEGLKFDVDFKPAMDDALDALDGFKPDFQTLADEWAGILTGKPIDIFGNVRADDDEFLEKIGNLRNLIQTGIVNEFEQGGRDAADTFLQSNAAQIAAASGLDITEVYRIMGLPPDGSIDTIIQPTIDADKAAKAKAILDALSSVAPGDERIVALQIALATDSIPGEVAETQALLLAQTLGIPVEATVTSNADEVQGDIDDATVDRRTQVFVPKSDSLGAMGRLIDAVARPRTVPFTVTADNAGAIARILDAVAKDRVVEFFSRINEGSRRNADATLDNVARDRTSTITVNTVGGGGGGGGGSVNGQAAVTATGLAAAPTTAVVHTPSAVTMSTPATVVNNNSISIRAGVLGNHFDVERSVTRALRRSARINGARAVTP